MTAPRDDAARRAPTPPLKKTKKGGGGWAWLFLFILAAALAAAVGFVFLRKQNSEASLRSTTDQMATPTVLVVHPTQGDAQVHLVLPGTVYALIESSVYAQVSGYIKAWHYDIGAQVRQGDLLAEIDTPVTDQQLKQAAESVKQAQANLELAKITAGRYNALYGQRAVSQQDVDNQNAQQKVQEANLSAAQAFESGIQKTEDFKQVRAPFDGVITARRIDVGDFVSATGQTSSANSASSGSTPVTTGTPNQELYRIAQTKILRVYVNVPEGYADQTRPGTKATMTLASSPSTRASGTLVRTADSIDQSSLTLLCEIDVDNADGKLLPGGYAQVQFDINTARPPLVIPGNTLIFRTQGPQVGVTDPDGTVHLRQIKIGRDLGTKLEITDGIKPDDQVILNPSDSLAEGQKVNIDTSQEKKQP
jgi:multidrug efflux pump subunit AcrA (membrane-fusion protein)